MSNLPETRLPPPSHIVKFNTELQRAYGDKTFLHSRISIVLGKMFRAGADFEPFYNDAFETVDSLEPIQSPVYKAMENIRLLFLEQARLMGLVDSCGGMVASIEVSDTGTQYVGGYGGPDDGDFDTEPGDWRNGRPEGGSYWYMEDDQRFRPFEKVILQEWQKHPTSAQLAVAIQIWVVREALKDYLSLGFMVKEQLSMLSDLRNSDGVEAK